MNKKADVFQLTFLIIILFIVAIVGLLFFTLSNRITDKYNELGIFDDAPNADYANSLINETAPKTTDYMIFMLFVGMVIGLLISASRTQFSPTLFFMFILLLIITIFISSGVVNIYSGFAQALPDESGKLILTGYLFSRYTPLIITCIGGLIMFIMWSKGGSEIIT